MINMDPYTFDVIIWIVRHGQRPKYSWFY